MKPCLPTLDPPWTVQENLLKLAHPAFAWLKQKTAAFNLTRLAKLRVYTVKPVRHPLFGACYHPLNKKKGYWTITAAVGGPFPCAFPQRLPGITRHPNDRWPEIPNDCYPGQPKIIRPKKLEWRPVYRPVYVANTQEAVVWIVAHELVHFLKATRQIKIKGGEIAADQFACQWLTEFKMSQAPQNRPNLT